MYTSSDERVPLTSTALSISAFPPFELVIPSTVAPTISATYFVSVRPSISLMSASAEVVRIADRNLLIRVVCFLRDASRDPLGSVSATGWKVDNQLMNSANATNSHARQARRLTYYTHLHPNTFGSSPSTLPSQATLPQNRP